MITLKDGSTVPYNDDFDIFFRDLINSIIKSSLRQASGDMKEGDNENAFNEHLLRQVMDNSIFVVHQIEEIAKENQDLSRLLVTGCLFNCIVMNIKEIGGSFLDEQVENEDDVIH